MGDEFQISNIQQIETEIILLKNQTAQNIIEIGKRLNQAKELVPHGEWGKWLEEKVDFSQEQARRFMKVALEFSNSTSLWNLPVTKIYALLDIPKDEREEFIQDNNVDEMTTRELQQVIKEKKELEKQVEELTNQKPKVIEKIIEKEIVPDDYEYLKREAINKQYAIEKLEMEKGLLEKKVDLNQREANEYNQLKNQIKTLTQEKNNLNRQINAATELSGLVVEVRHYFNKNFAPIKYSKAITEASKDRIVKENLKEILDIFQEWIDEMTQYITDDEIEYIEAEVIE